MALMPMFWGRDAILEVGRNTGLEKAPVGAEGGEWFNVEVSSAEKASEQATR